MRAILATALALTACSGPAHAPTGTQARTTPTRACVASPSGASWRFRGGLALTWPEWRGFGGWSDLRVSGDGQKLLAVSDDGHFVQAALGYNDGQLTSLTATATGALPHCPDKRRCDVESLAERADGTLWLGVEAELGSPHAIWAFAPTQPPFQGEPQRVPLPPGADQLPLNAGLEAMTALADDSVLAIPEGPEPVPPTLPLWHLQGQIWQTLAYPTVADFRPVALAALPAGHRLGDALVLERKWLVRKHEAGTRVVALRLPTATTGQATREVLRLQPGPCLIDNFEGLATRVADGALWLYLLSDDNQSAAQQTLLYAFSLE